MKPEEQYCDFSTQAVHGGRYLHGEHAHSAPIYATSTFTFDNAEQGMNRFAGNENGFIYSRFGNPTTAEAADAIAKLEAFGLKDEKGDPLELSALLHSSGQSAMVTMFLSNLKAGDKVLTHYSLYGGTHEFLFDFLPGLGIQSLITDFKKIEETENLLMQNPEIKIIHIESPANPTMDCTDLQAVVTLAKKFQVLVTVDNTFSTPYLQQPFRFGVDFVFHSTTKFLNGHGNTIGGVLIGKDKAFMKSIVNRIHKLLGGNSSPFDAFLLLQGLKTLPIRMEKHCSNAKIIAKFLSEHPAVSKVNFNGLPDHPDYVLSQRQMRHAGAVMSFELAAGLEGGRKFIDALRICVRAVSLGTADTLVSHPASMSHSGMKREDRIKSGITDGLIRMSVGLEDPNDLLQDLRQALSATI
ncbi:aminotransferase class I/II-fold pyridoxal phosphate-dependent enzyme [Pollutibacter soli]|uniref:trans-sulfuration enzyme family protein n=1 Tax=Pollutibacter soli TaxID=3034157 RepID=UPI003013F111